MCINRNHNIYVWWTRHLKDAVGIIHVACIVGFGLYVDKRVTYANAGAEET